MDKDRGSVLLRILVSVGIVLFALNSIFFYIDAPGKKMMITVFVSFLIQILLGIIIAVSSFKLTRKAYQFFIGLILLGWGILNVFVSFGLPHDINFWWPIYLILASVFIFIAGKVKYNKLKFGYLVPSITLLVMGIWFSLFSMKIVKVSFKTVVVMLGPAFLVLIGILLIVTFFLQQRHKDLVVKDESSGDFDDEDLSFPKLD